MSYFHPSSLVMNRDVLLEIIPALMYLKNKKILSLIEKSEKKGRALEKVIFLPFHPLG
jgi:hypothetical protein